MKKKEKLPRKLKKAYKKESVRGMIIFDGMTITNPYTLKALKGLDIIYKNHEEEERNKE